VPDPGELWARKRTRRFFSLPLGVCDPNSKQHPQPKISQKGVAFYVFSNCYSYLRRAKSRSVKKIIRCSGSAF
jgi:hypothetical protein